MDVNAVFESQPTVYEGSQISLRSELNLFELPPSDISTLFTSDYVQYFPLVSVKDQYSCVEFLITTETSGYVDPSDSFVAVSCRILQQDGEKISSTETIKVAPSNLFFHAMWSNLEVYINGQLISDSSNMYPYVAYLQRLLTKTESEKKNEHTTEFCYPNNTPDSTDDDGFKKRQKLSEHSMQFNMLGKLVANIFTQPRYLSSGTEIRIVLRRSQPEFSLDASHNSKVGVNGYPFKVEIDKVVFFAARKVVSTNVVDYHRRQLEMNKTFKYPVNEVQVKTFAVAKGLTSAATDAIVIGKIPKTIVLGIVSRMVTSRNLPSTLILTIYPKWI